MNGEALTPASPYIAKQNDTVQMGASTRSYKVDWVPVTALAQASEAAASVLERSSPNGSKASFRCKLGNIQVLLTVTPILFNCAVPTVLTDSRSFTQFILLQLTDGRRYM